MLWIDQKYINLISSQLEKFHKVDTGLWNFRCPICGDSAKNKSKCRGYVYTKSQSLFFNCKNCDESTTLYGLLKHVNPVLATEYNREVYIEKNGNRTPKEKPVEIDIPKTSCRLNGMTVQKPFSGTLKNLSELPESHEAVKYCMDRQIPEHQLKKLFYIDHISDITSLPGFSKYKDRIRGREPRIVIPYYNIDGKMTGVTCRGLRGEELRYVALKIVDDESLIFGIKDIDFTKPIYVVEGALDSLFLENCIAVGGTGLDKIDSLGIDKSKMIIVFDNEPRNKEVVGIIEKTIRNGYSVVIWDKFTKMKDINLMHLHGENYLDQLKNNVYTGLMARNMFNNWKKT